jgi:hypothetical protein
MKRRKEKIARDIPEILIADLRRFAAKIDNRGPNECWPWKGGTGYHGYGRIKIRGRMYLPHRIAYAISEGDFNLGGVGHGKVIMHSCDNPACCNPAHLSVGTMRENALDMVAKGRDTGWLKNLPPDFVVAVVTHPEPCRATAKKFAITTYAVKRLRKLARERAANDICHTPLHVTRQPQDGVEYVTDF